MLVKLQLSFLVLIAFAASAAAISDSVSGRVINQTVAKVSAGDDVILLRLGEGMQEVEHTRTDAQGSFTFTTDTTGGEFLVRVRHQGVNYDQQVSGSLPLELSVYDSVVKIPGLAASMGIAQVESDGANLKVTEMYAISNVSSPPVTQANARNFEINLPFKARLHSFQVKRAQGVWVNTMPAPAAGAAGRYDVDFPLRPGDTLFRFVYFIPATARTALKISLAYPVRTFGVVHPPSMSFKSSRAKAFTSPGAIKGLQLEQLVARDLIRDVPAFELSGIGIAPSPEKPVQAAPQVPQPVAKAPVAVAAHDRPASNANHQQVSEWWTILIALAILGAAGTVFILRTRRRTSLNRRSGTMDPDAASLAIASFQVELSQLEAEKTYGAISVDEYEAAKQALRLNLQRAVARTQN